MTSEARQVTAPTTNFRQRKRLSRSRRERRKPLYQAISVHLPTSRTARTTAADCIKDGKNIEPACGAGNFLGLLPEAFRDSKLCGVELDSVTGRVAKQLYPGAEILVQGFEDTLFDDGTFDLAVGNVPFGDYKLVDGRYNKHNFLIHDYFFAKALDKVRPGGIVAFVTSKGTMDKKNNAVRKYIAQRAELLGAVRLPNNAFLANAGTEVTADIVFLQKRERPIDVEPDWVHLSHDANGVPVNGYFAEHPEMVLGTMAYDSSMYGNNAETTCEPFPDTDLKGLLEKAVSRIDGRYVPLDVSGQPVAANKADSVPADPWVRNYSYTLLDGQVFFREGAVMNRVDKPETALSRITAMIKLRDCVRDLIDCQLNDNRTSSSKTVSGS
jgi:hypothetical protein